MKGGIETPPGSNLLAIYQNLGTGVWGRFRRPLLVSCVTPLPYIRKEGDYMGKAGDADKTAKLMSREKLVKKETARLRKLYEEIPVNKKKIVEGLIIQAARLRILLDEMWIDITENGDYDLFSQSEKQEPYERERPVAKLYNSRNDSYYRIIKQLSDILPANVEKDDLGATDGSDLL